MLSFIVFGFIGIIVLVVLGFLALVFVPLFLALIPVAIVGLFVWLISSIAGFIRFIALGILSILQTVWHALF